MSSLSESVDPKTCQHKPPIGEKLWSGKVVRCMVCHCLITLSKDKGKVNKSKKQRRREKAAQSERQTSVDKAIDHMIFVGDKPGEGTNVGEGLVNGRMSGKSQQLLSAATPSVNQIGSFKELTPLIEALNNGKL